MEVGLIKKGYDQIIERINPEDTLFDDFKLVKTLEIVKWY